VIFCFASLLLAVYDQIAFVALKNVYADNIIFVLLYALRQAVGGIQYIAAALDMKLDKAFDDVTERRGLSGASTNKLKLNLSAIFTAAVKKEIMRRNPCKLVTPPKVDTAPALRQ